MIPAPLAPLIADWQAHSPLAARCVDRLGALNHGDLPRWLAAVAELPTGDAEMETGVAFGPIVGAGSARRPSLGERQRLREALLALKPWRKGPFRLAGVFVDAEWRSDRKWARVAPHVDLAGRRVLDVGCGNGYYGWRMLEAGARRVTGIDPSLLAMIQHAAVARFAGRAASARNTVLPLRLERLETLAARETFDAVFSMGVIYHRRDGPGHVRDLARHAADNALLVLESLVVDGPSLRPRGRYARMPNVHVVPNVSTLLEWTRQAGFRDARVVDVTPTTTREQRATAWMPNHSLGEALRPTDATRTVEGYPAPKRAVIIARR